MGAHKRGNSWSLLSYGYPSRCKNELCRTLVICILFILSLILNTVILVWVHERYPKADPLPDLIFSLIPEIQQAAFPAEGNVTMHGGRADMYWMHMAMSVKEMLVGLGMNLVTKRYLCGDLIFSGHTIVLTLSWYIFDQYCPRRLSRWLSPVLGACCLAAMFCLVVSRKHYTFDIVASFYVCSNVFAVYNAISTTPELGNKAFIKHFWWSKLVAFAEGTEQDQSLLPITNSASFTNILDI